MKGFKMKQKDKKRILKINLFLILSFCISVFAKTPQNSDSTRSYEKETKQQRDERMQWWREARFGMFIHWGVYSVLGGSHDGKHVLVKDNYVGPWIMKRGKIPVADYKEYAKQFNPVDYDPESWVLLAKEAGMKYIVITSKHHEGFALFDSKVSDWDVVDATPYGKDLLKPLAEACRKHGMKLGFYYSQSSDWINPGGRKPGGAWDYAQKGDMKDYVRDVAVPQVRELLTNYGDVAVMWWDTPGSIPQKCTDDLQELMKIQPNIITNSRLGGKHPGDFKTPEQKIPSTSLSYDWETCMTMNKGWGYNKDDHEWKSTETLIRNLADIASKGGNYLLNVGPTAQGVIPEPSIVRLKEIGKWMNVNGESIYGTTASPFKELAWGRCTKKLHDDGAVLYLHVFEWPTDGELIVPGIKNEVKKSYLLENKKTLVTSSSDEGVEIKIPDTAPDKIDTVIVLEVAGDLKIE